MIGPGTGIVAPPRTCLITRTTISTKTKNNNKNNFNNNKNNTKNKGQEQYKNWLLVKTILYFGCHAYNKDYLYCEELQANVQDGTLTQLNVAFSHEEEEQQQQQEEELGQETTTTKIIMTTNKKKKNNKKVYVQHLLLQQAQEIYMNMEHISMFAVWCPNET